MDDLLLKKITERWDSDINSLQLINKGINFIYRFEVGGRTKILKISRSANRSYQELASGLDYQRHLYKHQVPVPALVTSIDGNYLETINTESQTYIAHVLDAIPAQTLQVDHDDQKLYKIWGNALAQLHAAAKLYRSCQSFQFVTYQTLWSEVYSYLQDDEKEIKKEYAAIAEWLSSLSKNSETYGLSHGDHRIGNVLCENNQVYIIDFDEPVYHWFIADIARPFLESCASSSFNWQEIFSPYLDGYQSILPIDKKHLEQIPWFIRMKNLDLYLWTKNNWQQPIAPGGMPTGEWLAQRRQMIVEPKFLNWFR